MSAGRLKERVTIERLTQGQDEIGQPINEWRVLGTVWAAVEPLNGREYLAAGAEQSQVTTRIRIRYFAGLTSADRVTHEGTQYDIKSVIDPQTRREEIVLMCATLT